MAHEVEQSESEQHECRERRAHAEQDARPEQLVEEAACQVPECHPEPEIEPIHEALQVDTQHYSMSAGMHWIIF